MSAGNRISLLSAEAIVADLLPCFRGACERLQIVGSIRRRSSSVGDIEVLVIPRFVSEGMFGQDKRSLLDDALSAMVQARTLIAVNNGKVSKRFKVQPDGVGLDVFVSTPERWGVEMVVRTGPGPFSKALVTDKQYGGLLPYGMRVADGWRLKRGDEVIQTPTEESVFEAIGLAWIPPEWRDVWKAVPA